MLAIISSVLSCFLLVTLPIVLLFILCFSFQEGSVWLNRLCEATMYTHTHTLITYLKQYFTTSHQSGNICTVKQADIEICKVKPLWCKYYLFIYRFFLTDFSSSFWLGFRQSVHEMTVYMDLLAFSGDTLVQIIHFLQNCISLFGLQRLYEYK